MRVFYKSFWNPAEFDLKSFVNNFVNFCKKFCKSLPNIFETLAFETWLLGNVWFILICTHHLAKILFYTTKAI